MTPFDQSNKPLPGFTLDRRKLMMKRTLKGREWRLIITLPLAVMIMAVLIQYLIGYASLIPHGPLEPVIIDRVLKPMAPPRLSDAPGLPTAAAVAEQLPLVRELLADHANVRHNDELDALTVAWAQELLRADAQAPPIPQRVVARDLLLDGVRPGAAVVLHGRLEDSITAPLAEAVAGSANATPITPPITPEAAVVYQRLVIRLDEQQTVQVLAPADAATLIIGREIQAVGRFLGEALVPTGTSGDTVMPLVVARSVRFDETRQAEGDQDLAEMRTGVPSHMPDDLYDNLNDERSVLESRAYYYQLGQAKLDLVAPEAFANAPVANVVADDIHQDPRLFRGKPFTLSGYVYRAWEDANVARDQPFGIDRVQRILLWNRDLGKLTELVDGKVQIKTQILRLYEACLIGAQPLPKRGDKLTLQGRFLKFRAIPVEPNSLRDAKNNVTRQSDNAYTFVFVGNAYDVVPPPPLYTFKWFDVIVVVASLALGVLLYWLMRRDTGFASKVSGQIERLRKTRKGLTERQQAAIAAASSTVHAPDPAQTAPTLASPETTSPTIPNS